MRLLLVDDEQNNLDELEAILRQLLPSAELFLCVNPLEAAEKIAAETYDLALLDIQMPGMTGLELAEQINATTPNTTVVFISAYNYYAAEAFDINAIDYILKPLRLERVERAIQKFTQTERRQSTQQSQTEPSVFAFGDNRLLCGSQEIRWNRGKTGELFWFLFMQRGAKTHKEELCSLLWSEFELRQAMANMQVTVHRLRKDLNCFNREQLRIDYVRDFYHLHLRAGYCDVDHFDTLAQRVDRPEDLLAAVSLYTGAFLGKAGWQWAEYQRESLCQKYLHALSELTRHYLAKQDYLAAEQLLVPRLSGDILTDSLSIFLLEASLGARGKRGMQEAYKRLERTYRLKLDMAVPATVEEIYKKKLQ